MKVTLIERALEIPFQQLGDLHQDQVNAILLATDKGERAARHAVHMMDVAQSHNRELQEKRKPVPDFVSIDGPAVSGLPTSLVLRDTPIAVGSFLVKEKARAGHKESRKALHEHHTSKPILFTTKSALHVSDEERIMQRRDLHATAMRIRREEEEEEEDKAFKGSRGPSATRRRPRTATRTIRTTKGSDDQEEVLPRPRSAGAVLHLSTDLSASRKGHERSRQKGRVTAVAANDMPVVESRAASTAQQAVSDAREIVRGCIRTMVTQCSVVNTLFGALLGERSGGSNSSTTLLGAPDMQGLSYENLTRRLSLDGGIGPTSAPKRVDSGLQTGRVKIKKPSGRSARTKNRRPSSAPALRPVRGTPR